MEATSGLLAAIAVSPFVSVIDRAIVVNAAGLDTFKNSIVHGFEMMIKKPFSFVRQPYFLCVLGVFSGTYIAANTSDSLLKYNSVPVILPKFLTTAAVNIYLSVRKDAIYCQLFGSPGVPRHPLPRGSWFLFGIRDSMTMLSSFVIPPYLAPIVQYNTNFSPGNSLYLSQFVAPAMIQFLSTPINLYGLHMHFSPIASVSSRLLFIRQEYFATLALRLGRIIPAFGIGGVMNTRLRELMTQS